MILASFSISRITTSSVYITVSGLTETTTVRVYLRLSSSDTATFDNEYINANSYIGVTVSGLTANTEYAVNVKVGDTWLGAQYFTTDAPQSVRPSDWTWNSTIASGAEIKISAVEWNDFCTRINDFREYSGLSSYGFTVVHSGDDISASIVNQARTAISAISGAGALPSAAVSRNEITASFFLGLKNALNAIL